MSYVGMILFRRLSAFRLRRAYSTCHSCSSPLPFSTLVCPKCSSISALSSKITHHQLFGIPDEPNPFVVNLADLRKKFRAAQAWVHPDVWASKSPREQDLAHTLSSRVNEAYQTLLNPLSRAEYILQLNGHPLSEHDQVQDLEFMATVMELRELIDDTEDTATLEQLMEHNDEDTKVIIEQLQKLIEQKNWPEAKNAAIRLRYLNGIERAAKTKISS